MFYSQNAKIAHVFQFSNPSNPEAHYLSTGPEIWRQTQGAVDIVVFGVGTAGTMTGVGNYLLERKKSVQIYCAEPDESAVINGDKPGTHGIAGIGAGVLPDNLAPIYAEALRVKTADSLVMAKRMAREEGILCGISSGANVLAAIEVSWDVFIIYF